MSQALNRCVNCLPGQRDVDNAIRTVGEASKTLLADSVSTGYLCCVVSMINIYFSHLFILSNSVILQE